MKQVLTYFRNSAWTSGIIVPLACMIGTAGLMLNGCKSAPTKSDAAGPQKVIHLSDMNLIAVDPHKADLFPLAESQPYVTPALLNATGTVMPDVSRTIPVISLVSGRVVQIGAHLDDAVSKGQLMMRVQSPDATAALDAYRRAVNDEVLTHRTLDRTQQLYDHGAAAKSALEQAQNGEQDAQSVLTAAQEQLKTLGLDARHPSDIVSVYAPVSGVVIAQNVTSAAAAGVTYAGSATAFTIADLSTVWVLCDVYENQLAELKLGQPATIHLNAYPDRTLTGKIDDIGPVLDPSIRTAKVRVVVHNPGYLRLGMFATVTFRSLHPRTYTKVPATAILHLHDRAWVFVPAGPAQFRRVEIQAGDMLPGDQQEITDGLAPGTKVVSNALSLESAVSE